MDESLDALKVKKVFWQKKLEIPGTNWVITGYSRSAYRTGFYIPALDMMLDAGPQNFNKPSHIFITHTHIDHIASLPLTMIGDEAGNHIFNLYAIGSAQHYLANYINSMFSVNCMRSIDACTWYKFHGLMPTDKFRINTKNIYLEISVFNCDHSVPTISYGFSEIKKKLKGEFLSLSGKEIVALKKAGTDISEEVMCKKFAFVCDTSIRVFEMNPEILEYKVIFIECTFVEPDELKNAIDTKHIHWSQLRPYVEENKDNIFVLIHFSQRYRDSDITDFFQKEVDAGLNNLRWW
jgi:ribonuclease Z